MTKRITMNKHKQILQLHHEYGDSQRKIGELIGISKTTVANSIKAHKNSGLSWPLPKEYEHDEEALEKALYTTIKDNQEEIKFFQDVKEEFGKHKDLTLKGLWRNKVDSGLYHYSYKNFVKRYKKINKTKAKPTMNIVSIPGKKMSCDYAGSTMTIYDPNDLSIAKSKACIFVGRLNHSGLIYCEATATQNIMDFCGSIQRWFKSLEGTAEVFVCDNLKSAVNKPDLYEPVLNGTFQKLMEHYGVAALPARVCRPKDKAGVESDVCQVQRRIAEKLRDIHFTSLESLNIELKKIQEEINSEEMQISGKTRKQRFEEEEKLTLKPLVKEYFSLKVHKKFKTKLDYTFHFEKNIYSVPYEYSQSEIDAWMDDQIIECYYKGRLIATHVRQRGTGEKVILKEHLAPNHLAYTDSSVDQLLEEVKTIGAKSFAVAEFISANYHQLIAVKKIHKFLKLKSTYQVEDIEKVCEFVLAINHIDLNDIEALLLKKYSLKHTHHEDVRGAVYYQNK